MKTTTKIVSGLLTGFTLMMATASGIAANVDVNIGLPGFYAEPRPVYVRPEYENDWRERRVRADHWRAEDHHDNHDNGNRHNKYRRDNKHHDKHDRHDH
jgi:hypothetical protein